MCRVGAFDDRGKLRVADSGHLARGAHRTGADANLDDINTVENQLFGHLARNNVTRHQDDVRVSGAQLVDEADEGLGVAVGDIDTDVTDAAIGTLHDAAELVIIVR